MVQRSTTTRLSPRQDSVRRLYEADASTREIAGALGITTQRVYQHLRRLAELGLIEYPKDAA